MSESSSSSTSLIGKPVFFELVCARGVVKSDLMSESDPYVKVAIRDGDKTTSALTANSIEHKFPTIDDEPNPYWGLTVWLAKEAKQGQFLHISLYDEDTASRDDLLGHMAIPIEKFCTGKLLTLKIPFAEDPKKIQEVDVRFKEFPQSLLKKRVIIIRHGESEWNEGQSQKNIRQMVSRVDHPLTNLGAGQALSLAVKIQQSLEKQQEQNQGDHKENTSSSNIDDAVKDVLNTEVIYVSPLCRAVQTALLALHPLGTKPSWILRKNAREKRNFGGRDSSGTTFGKDLLPFYVKEIIALGENYNEAAKMSSSTSSLPPGGKIDENAANDSNIVPFPSSEKLAQLLEKLDKKEAETKWWTDDRENSDDSSRRISDLFFQQVMWDPRPVVVIVGHSHFFRDTFVHYLSETMRNKIKNKESGYNEYSLDQWFHYKLENCGAAHLEFDFSRLFGSWTAGTPPSAEDYKCIEDVKLLFGTTLIP